MCNIVSLYPELLRQSLVDIGLLAVGGSVEDLFGAKLIFSFNLLDGANGVSKPVKHRIPRPGHYVNKAGKIKRNIDVLIYKSYVASCTIDNILANLYIKDRKKVVLDPNNDSVDDFSVRFFTSLDHIGDNVEIEYLTIIADKFYLVGYSTIVNLDYDPSNQESEQYINSDDFLIEIKEFMVLPGPYAAVPEFLDKN